MITQSSYPLKDIYDKIALNQHRGRFNMKILLSILTGFILFVSIDFVELKHPELPVTLSYSTTIEHDNYLQHSILELLLTVDNKLDYDIKEITLVLDTYLDDVFVEQVEFTFQTEIKHHKAEMIEVSYRFDNIYFDEIEIVSFSMVQATFFESYNGTITMGIFFSIALFVMWMIGDINRGLITSEVNEILKEYWWAALLIVVLLPALISFFIFVGRYYVLTTIFGWIFFITALISSTVMYGILMLYHYLKGL